MSVLQEQVVQKISGLLEENLQFLFSRSNEPSGHACMYICRLPQGSNTPQLATLEI